MIYAIVLTTDARRQIAINLETDAVSSSGLSHRDPCESELKMADRIQYHGLMKNLPQSTRTYNREFPSAHARTRLSLLTSSIVLYTTVARSDSIDRCKCACACVCLSVFVFPLPMVNVWDSVSMNLSL